MNHTQSFFDNQVQKAEIKQALTAAIPPNVTYYNLILALTELLQDFARLAFADDVNKYDPAASRANGRRGGRPRKVIEK